MQAHGNKEVVQLLEKWLATARIGKLNFAAIAASEIGPLPSYPVVFNMESAGDTDMQRYAVTAIEALRNNISDEVQNRSPPSADPSLDASYVSYNLAGTPVSWDFLPWLIDAEMTRIRENAPAPLKVAFLNGLNGKLDAGSNYRQQMLDKVVRPLLPMVGAVENSAAAKGRHKKLYTMRDISAAARAGETVPKLQPSGKGVGHYVTITLREAEHWPHRNSDLASWLKFAGDLRDKGETVAFVRDTRFASNDLEGFTIYPRAARHVESRLWLYEYSKCNLFVMNGPASLAWFGSRPWLSFVDPKPDDPHEPSRPGWWLANQGIEDGGQLPWSRSDQRLVWKSDSYKNLCEAWECLGF